MPEEEYFQVGDKVYKHSGDYQLLGEVRGRAITKAGKFRYVVEHEPGFLHIYSAANLRLVRRSESSDDCLHIHSRHLDC